MTTTSERSSRAQAPLFRPAVAYALAAASGFVYFLGVPGVDLWPTSFVAQVPLILALRGQGGKRGAALGLLAGTVFSLGTFHWLVGTLQRFAGFPAPVALLVTVLMCTYSGGRMALTGWLTCRAEERGWPAAPAFVSAFIAGELVYPLLFPWYAATTLLRAPLFVQTADLGGVYLVAAVLCAPNLVIAEIVRARLERARPSRAVMAASLATLVLAAVYGAVRLRQVEAMDARAPSLTIGLAQGNLPLVGRTRGIAINRGLTRKLRKEGADLVVWSEGAISEVFDEASYAEDVKKHVTGRLGVPVILGGGVKRGEGASYREYNTAFLADETGEVIGRYDKHHLLPFGELLPFGDWFPSLYRHLPHAGHLSPGSSLEPVRLAGHPITILICYEDILPGFVNRAVRHGKPEILVNITIDSWFGDTIEPWTHLGFAALRAIEHRRYLVRATNSGVSAIVDATGRVTKHGGVFDQETLTGDVKLMAPTTLHELVGDVPWYLCTLAIVAMALVRPRRSG